MGNIYEYKYPHHAVTTDSVVFGFDGKELQLLLVERGLEPYKGCWALPGGFLRPDETVEQCAKRELREETGVENVYLEQFHVFSSVDRDPRERVITVAFVVLVKKSDYKLIANDDAVRASWFLTDELPPLAFDHYKIIKRARKHLRTMLRERPIVFKLLDRKFSITELQRLYEIINDTKYDRRNFARKITSSGLLREEGVSSESSHNRFPNLYSFDEEGYNEMMADDEDEFDEDFHDRERRWERDMEKQRRRNEKRSAGVANFMYMIPSVSAPQLMPLGQAVNEEEVQVGEAEAVAIEDLAADANAKLEPTADANMDLGLAADANEESKEVVDDLSVADASMGVQDDSYKSVLMSKREVGPGMWGTLRNEAIMDDDFMKMYREYRQMKMERKMQKRVAKKKKPRNPFDI